MKSREITTSGVAPQWIPILGAVVLALLYTGYYLANPSLPGNGRPSPIDWWAWFDQGKYIKSARALWAGDFSPAKHWFPMGYSLLAVPFIGWLPNQPFFFVDLGGLLIAYAAFQSFARRLNVSGFWSAPIFILAALADPRLAETWAVPWNTTVSAALIWVALAATAALIAVPANVADRTRLPRLAMLGLVFGAMPLVRPTDALIGAICGAILMVMELWHRTLRWRDAAALIVGALIMLAPYAVLYDRIYGLHQTAYVLHSRHLGFAFSQFPWKAYVLLIEPHPWFPHGLGLLARMPWVVLSLAAVVPVLARLRGRDRLIAWMLVISIFAYCFLFFSYIDLLPSGLWLYGNVHYFQWVFPALGLLAFLLLRELWSGRRPLAIASLIMTVLVLSVRIGAVRVGEGAPARMVQFPGLRVDWTQSYFGREVIEDSKGKLPNIEAMRLLPDSEGLRAIALKRQFIGPVRWAQGGSPGPKATGIVPLRWGERLSLGYPCWLPPYPCDASPPHS